MAGGGGCDGQVPLVNLLLYNYLLSNMVQGLTDQPVTQTALPRSGLAGAILQGSGLQGPILQGPILSTSVETLTRLVTATSTTTKELPIIYRGARIVTTITGTRVETETKTELRTHTFTITPTPVQTTIVQTEEPDTTFAPEPIRRSRPFRTRHNFRDSFLEPDLQGSENSPVIVDPSPTLSDAPDDPPVDPTDRKPWKPEKTTTIVTTSSVSNKSQPQPTSDPTSPEFEEDPETGAMTVAVSVSHSSSVSTSSGSTLPLDRVKRHSDKKSDFFKLFDKEPFWKLGDVRPTDPMLEEPPDAFDPFGDSSYSSPVVEVNLDGAIRDNPLKRLADAIAGAVEGALHPGGSKLLHGDPLKAMKKMIHDSVEEVIRKDPIAGDAIDKLQREKASMENELKRNLCTPETVIRVVTSTVYLPSTLNLCPYPDRNASINCTY
ncbi:unnamed protein product [Darwinula stevensoni]|uniref:Uncharacterized protein n=1 Tax=Darwinula stevensoni TaxID=69355 RepID=A0A7R9A0Y4_9CRUS|nr:unnamed protein product [Darwinula stevensoni]CAG0885503.1 unnamed protein product [Darwinula stevensoni]